jgi:glycerophosphoryl diester phosphodiesterase
LKEAGGGGGRGLRRGGRRRQCHHSAEPHPILNMSCIYSHMQAAAVHHSLITPSFVSELQSLAGKAVYGWTVSTPEVLQQVLEAGVDGVVTDHPAAAMAAIEAWMVKCR